MVIGEVFGLSKRMPELFWKIKGAKQGDLKNKSDYKSMEAYSRIYSVQWGAHGPMDTNTGNRMGKTIMGGVSILKIVDGSTPLLMQALCTNEHITEAEFVYMDIPGKSTTVTKPTKILSVLMKDGFISKIDCGTTADGAMVERIDCWYSKILWRHEIDPKTEYEENREQSLA